MRIWIADLDYGYGHRYGYGYGGRLRAIGTAAETTAYPVNASYPGRVPASVPPRRYLPATPPSRGGRPVCRYRC